MKDIEGKSDMTAGNPDGEESREGQILNEMFSAASEESWDAAPGFESRVTAHLRDTQAAGGFDPSRLIWRAVPAAAAIAIVAVAISYFNGPSGPLESFIVSNMTEPVILEDLITLGLF